MTKKTRKRSGKGKSAGRGRVDESGTVDKNIKTAEVNGNDDEDGSNKNEDDKKIKEKQKTSKQQRRSLPSSPGNNYDLPAAMMCIPAATDDQQQRANNTHDGSIDMAMLIDLSRRQMAMQQQAAAGGGAGGFGGNQKGSGAGGAGGGSALANYAGSTADSFAQSFVNRFAGKLGGVGGGGEMPSLSSQQSAMRGGNPIFSSSWQQQQMNQQGGSGGMSESDYRMMRMMMEYTNNGGQQQQQHGRWRDHEMYNSFGDGGGGGLGMMPSYGNNMMNPMQHQQMNTSFLGCLPIGTSIPSAATGMGGGVQSERLQLGGGGSGEMIAPSLPAFSMPLPSRADADTDADADSPKQRSTTSKKRKAPLRKEHDPEIIQNSKGPFKILDKPILLALDGDDYWLTPLHCFVRKNCVEVFTATVFDSVKTPTKGKRRTVSEGQIGIRCPHCNKKGENDSGSSAPVKKDVTSRGSVYYPNSIGNVYNATMNLLQRHLFLCPQMPPEIIKKYSILKKDDARSGTSKKYWIESAKCLGFVDTLTGMKLSAKPPPPPPVPVMSSYQVEAAAARKRTRDLLEGKFGVAKDDETDPSSKDVQDDSSPLVFPNDDQFTKFSYLLMSQMRRCVFTEADRLGKRKGLTNGFAGLACRHCFGGFGSGRFFPSSIKTLSDTSKTLDVIFHHFERCREIPESVLVELAEAKKTHETERSNLKFGSQKGECLIVPQ